MNFAFLAAAAAQAFNLNCSGTETTLSVRPPFKIEEKYNRIYRIDLNSMRWCAGECADINAIKEANEKGIILIASPIEERDSSVSDMLNRGDGSHFSLVRGKNHAVSLKGTCEPSPFTGFPQAQSKTSHSEPKF